MTVPTFAAYSQRVIAPLRVPIVVGTSPVVTSGFGSLWRTMISNPVPSIPSTAAALNYADAGAIGLRPSVGMRFLGVDVARNSSAGAGSVRGGLMILCDRLSHQGGLVGNTNSVQTTNLPTAALTRYTTGDGVMVGYEIYSGLGGTGTTITASYTNQAGLAGQVTTALSIGTGTYNTTGTFRIFGLAAGDTGVRAVASVTLAATTGTAGNFGVTLFRPLAMIPIPWQFSKFCAWDALLHLGANIVEPEADGHLFFLFAPFGSTFNNMHADLLWGAD